MPNTLTTKSPLEFNTVTIPTDNDSMSFTGEILNTFTQLKDRTDYILAKPILYHFSASIAASASVNFYQDVVGVTKTIPSCSIGDTLQIFGDIAKPGSSDMFARFSVTDPDNMVTYSCSSTQRPALSFSMIYPCLKTGSHVVKIQTLYETSGGISPFMEFLVRHWK